MGTSLASCPADGSDASIDGDDAHVGEVELGCGTRKAPGARNGMEAPRRINAGPNGIMPRPDGRRDD